jgi:uncharacterized protein involved in exopolysaccharide biosynthesis
MNPSEGINISQILGAVHRRRDIIIAISLVIITLATYLTLNLPNVYRSSTLILVTPQRLPSNYVASIVTT